MEPAFPAFPAQASEGALGHPRHHPDGTWDQFQQCNRPAESCQRTQPCQGPWEQLPPLQRLTLEPTSRAPRWGEMKLPRYNREGPPKTYLIQLQLVAQFNMWLVEMTGAQPCRFSPTSSWCCGPAGCPLRERYSTGSADKSWLTPGTSLRSQSPLLHLSSTPHLRRRNARGVRPFKSSSGGSSQSDSRSLSDSAHHRP